MKRFIKKTIIAAGILTIALALAACGSNNDNDNDNAVTTSDDVGGESAIVGLPTATATFTPGTFTGTATGYGGDLSVAVTFTANQITGVAVTNHNESTYGQGWFLRAYPGVADQILVRQSTQNIDAFSGATMSRDAIIAAAEDAIAQAGASPSDLTPQFISEPLPGDRFIPGFHVITVPAGTMDIYGDPLTDGAVPMLHSEDTDMTLRVSFGRNEFHLHNGGGRGLGQGNDGHGESVYAGEISGGTWGSWWFRQVAHHQVNDVQSSHVDIRTGATSSASAIVWGLEQAMIAAGADPAGIMPRAAQPQISRNPASPDARMFLPGIYTATAEGFGGDITLSVTLDRNTIRRIVVSSQNETESFWETVWPDIRDLIYEEQTTNFDTADVFTGATRSADAVVEAVRDAMRQAGETNPDNW